MTEFSKGILNRDLIIGRGGEDTRPNKAGKIYDPNMIPAKLGYTADQMTIYVPEMILN